MEEQEFTPLTPGSITISEKREKINFPVGVMLEAHIEDGRYTYVDKVVEDRETGEDKTIKQAKVLFTFVVDAEAEDADGNSLKGKSFVKGITLSTHDRATYPKLSTAVTGGIAQDPSTLIGKPLQVMFAAEADFEGTKYQPITYLPPVKGQKVPPKDKVLTSEEEVDAAIEEVFGPVKND